MDERALVSVCINKFGAIFLRLGTALKNAQASLRWRSITGLERDTKRILSASRTA